MDAAARTGKSKTEAKYEAVLAIQNLLGYLKEHTDGAVPPENLIIFDEAQRAWDEGRPKSEPELFLDILQRLDWACLVCLVGPGQEINRGEGGLALWGEALSKAAASGHRWRVVAAPQAFEDGPDVSGRGLAGGARPAWDSEREPRLHLSNSMRAYRNSIQEKWVAALLRGEIADANAMASRLEHPPAYLARDISAAREWLRQRRRGGRSVGLLASSGAVRLVADGIPPSPRSNELDAIGHWFLKPHDDFRSAGALETPMSEFGCQGLELDYVGLCWGGDLIWREDEWTPRQMRAPRWQVLRDEEKRRFRLNAYRVLLTRARAGTVIYVPLGHHEDPTRREEELQGIYDTLVEAGCHQL